MMNFNENPESGNGNGGMFLRLKAGESVKVIPRGDNKVFFVKWNGSKSQPCEKGSEGAKFRFKFNAVVNEDGVYKAKIFEQGAILYNALKELAEDYNLEETVLKISRKGNGLDTTYSVMPMPTKLGAEQLELISQVALNSLEPKEKEESFGPEPSFDSEEEILF